MKKIYNNPEVEIINFATDDILTASGETTYEYNQTDLEGEFELWQW